MSLSENLHAGRYIVCGDLMIDEYHRGKVSRISPEAPIPVLDGVKISRAPGGAANVAMNLAGLGNRVELVGLVGEDENGRRLKEYLARHGVGVGGVFSDPSRTTISKVRFATPQQQLMRADYEDTGPVDSALAGKLAAYFEQLLSAPGVDGVLISDYNKGLLTSRHQRHPLVVLAKKISKLPLLCGADTKKRGPELKIFAGFHFLKPNLAELKKAAGLGEDDPGRLPQACHKYLAISKARSVLVTLGAEGIYHYDGSRGIHVPAIKTRVSSVIGAGDTVFAVAVHSLASGLGWIDALRLANIAASLVIEQQGTKAITREELAGRVALLESTFPEYFNP